ncbi:hypothetical protein JOC49_001153 [Fusibacter tunisiensis]|jgi:hypothetical protein|uniref:Uncharacterized protein n=1 Tax=Fusibacter tunisiensis TaxID=1008308 RepID=A0ABS2MQG1_9FIRM|nr:hypothetical protein [Fusibacter tunisiensis]
MNTLTNQIITIQNAVTFGIKGILVSKNQISMFMTCGCL